jgi:putative spermidine/putrescine transport system ATP-binding protein
VTPAAGSRFSELRLERVSRRFGDQVALHELDLTIKGGEFVALLGASGCGKSTALNTLAGLLPLTGGSIWLDDQRIDGLPPERRGFGMVFQNYALFPHMSVRRNIGFGLRMRKVGRDELRRRVEDAIRLVQLEDHASKFPAQLSGGQQQRVAIARAIVLEPPLVLMDEPLSNLDAKLRLEMRTEIRRIHQTMGVTTVYVTHDQEEALSLADRLAVLRAGVVQQVGTPDEIYSQPTNRYVAGFMGYRNELELAITAVAGERVTLRGDGVEITGVRRDEVADRAVVMVRPDDFVVGDDTASNPIDVTVEVVEYQGRLQAAQVRTAGGQPLHIRTERHLAPGDTIRIGTHVDRALVFAADSPKAPEEVA